ncbi:uncharacterized protein LOC100900970, partial [Galendromus occidentalis]|uniref:Uncharacterized protein LOC100900970 n=1 Tax=Galendromus occidentalis TaxID=34638 RepID=A0AAJ6VX56_9ACAR
MLRTQDSRALTAAQTNTTVHQPLEASSALRFRLAYRKEESSDSSRTVVSVGKSPTVSPFRRLPSVVVQSANMVNSIFEYGDVWKEDRGAMAPGKLKLTDQNIVFKNAKTGKVDQINNGEVES